MKEKEKKDFQEIEQGLLFLLCNHRKAWSYADKI